MGTPTRCLENWPKILRKEKIPPPPHPRSGLFVCHVHLQVAGPGMHAMLPPPPPKTEKNHAYATTGEGYGYIRLYRVSNGTCHVFVLLDLQVCFFGSSCLKIMSPSLDDILRKRAGF